MKLDPISKPHFGCDSRLLLIVLATTLHRFAKNSKPLAFENRFCNGFWFSPGELHGMLIVPNPNPGGGDKVQGQKSSSKFQEESMTKQQALVKRLKTIEGHAAKVRKMVEEDAYCIDIINQSTAVQQALRKVDFLILDRHLRSCAVKHMKAGRADLATKEILSVFKRT